MTTQTPEDTTIPALPPEPADTTALEQDEKLPPPRGEELIAVVEALLFAATAPLSLPKLSELTSDTPQEEIAAVIELLKARYEAPTSGLMVWEVAGGFQLATKPPVADWILLLHKHRRRNPLTPALMETLAIVAYKQPLVRAEIEAIRGVDCGGVLRSLQDAGLVEVVGRKETVGHPALYGTTETFMKTFGLKGLHELPALGEWHKAPVGEDPGPRTRDQMGGGGDSGVVEGDESPKAHDQVEAGGDSLPHGDVVR